MTERPLSGIPTGRITVKHGDLRPVLLPLLRGTVFHVTSTTGFDAIEQSGIISSNRHGELPFTFPQSSNSYGRNLGYVCLFDLRDVSDEIIADGLKKFYFLQPTPADPAFLFIAPTEAERIVPWTAAPIGAMAIPHVEAWYPSDLSLSALSHALVVTIEPDDVDSAYRRTLRSLVEDKDELLDSGHVNIQARALDELQMRVDQWVRIATDAGLEVELGWDLNRVEQIAHGYCTSVKARRLAYWRNLDRS